MRDRRRRVITPLLLTVALLAAGCGSTTDTGVATAGAVTSTDGEGAVTSTAETPPPTDTTNPDTTNPDATNPDAGSSTSSASSSTSTYRPPATTPPAAEELALAVGAEGFEVVDGGSIVRLPFGTPRDQAVTALTGLLGFDPESSPGSPDCGNNPDEVLVWADEVLVDVRDGAIISWLLRQGSSLTTIAGTGLGSTRAQLEDAYVIEVSDGSVGIEFVTDPEGPGIAGLLSGPGPNATVTELWAGEVCIFR